MVVNEWVEQAEVLRHKAYGRFFNHCGWNSVTEASMVGVRMLGWPRLDDQWVNGGVVRRSELGVWIEWSWDAKGGVIGREQIGKAVKEMMENETLRRSMKRVGEEAAKSILKENMTNCSNNNKEEEEENSAIEPLRLDPSVATTTTRRRHGHNASSATAVGRIQRRRQGGVVDPCCRPEEEETGEGIQPSAAYFGSNITLHVTLHATHQLYFDMWHATQLV